MTDRSTSSASDPAAEGEAAEGAAPGPHSAPLVHVDEHGDAEGALSEDGLSDSGLSDGGSSYAVAVESGGAPREDPIVEVSDPRQVELDPGFIPGEDKPTGAKKWAEAYVLSTWYAPGGRMENRPKAPKPNDITFVEDLLSSWLAGMAASTKRVYLDAITAFFSALQVPIRRVTTEDINKYLRCLEEGTHYPDGREVDPDEPNLEEVDLEKPEPEESAPEKPDSEKKEHRPLAAATRHRIVATLKSFFGHAAERRYIEVDPARSVSYPKVPSTKAERYLSRDVVELLIEGAETLRNRALLTLLYYGGFRRAELAGLCWESVEERPGVAPGVAQVSVVGKGEKARTVLVSATCWEVLRELRRAERAQGRGWAGDPVFRSQKRRRKGDQTARDYPLSEQGIYDVVKQVAKTANVPSELASQVSPHSFRHAHITHSVERGAKLPLVSKNVGHANVQTTMAYVHARPDEGTGLYLE